MAGFEAGLLISAVRRYVPLKLAWRLVPASILKKRAEFFTKAISIVDKRMKKGADVRPDFLSYIMRHSGDEEDFKGFVDTAEKIVPTAALVVMGGGHTISTLLANTVYFLLRRPETMERLVKEIRSSFNSADEINHITASTRLPYLLAIFEEVLRIFPPLGFGIPRVVPQEGLEVDGCFIPSGVRKIAPTSDES
jgi:cytochrome P450